MKDRDFPTWTDVGLIWALIVLALEGGLIIGLLCRIADRLKSLTP